MKSLGEAHSEHLEQVEDKVKSALGKRDALIARLKEELRDAQSARQSAEKILSDLQSGLSFR